MIAPRHYVGAGQRPGGDLAPLDLGPGRECSCGRRISRYNPNERCWSCTGHPIPRNPHIEASLDVEARRARHERVLARLEASR